ncbi:hypothetical protein C9374_001844 [Naegleria lovaniensis]|uniref:Uncharacterized protein n=1 Tax=Naegleria lovaniensis TaxID=51637 RepID=A0AA88GW41_NAELO|nr:uncharacterized protein C9374_001844 [Naegleria lovaniensis]KAG2386809.1 hypothetical protein C9374_001844 [Naegleria lovaniensis]
MKRLSLCLFLVLFCVLTLQASYHSVLAQQCKNRKPFANPAPCSGCTFCTATASSSCCTAQEDSAASLSASLGKIISQGCYEQMAMAACAVCDPKNSQYINTDTMQMKVCKSACQRLASSCGTSSTICDSLPTTDCWSEASTVKSLQVMGMMMVVMLLMSVFLMW